MGGRLINLSNVEFKQVLQTKAYPLPGSFSEPIKYTFSVKQKFDKLSLIEFLKVAKPHVSKEFWLNKIENKQFFLNDKLVTVPTCIVRGGNVLHHFSDPIIEPEVSLDIDLIFQNEDFLVINKPSPLPMHPAGRFKKNSLIELLRLAFPNEDFYLVHRLDANTTGLVIIGKTKKACTDLINQFESKVMKKEYLALIEGLPKEQIFSCEGNILSNPDLSGSRKMNVSNSNSLTHFKVIKTNSIENVSLLKVQPVTGRTNQIRVHLAALGYPIVGDIGYKDSTYFIDNPLTYNEDQLFLHAHKLSFQLGIESYSFEAPIPDKFTPYL